MPELVLFVACERPIVDQFDNNLSLISVLTNIDVPVPAGETVPEDARTFLNWGAVAVWSRSEEEEDLPFEQRIDLLLPNGRIDILDSIVEFSLGEGFHRNLVTIQGFPIGFEGTCRLRLGYRHKGEEDWSIVSQFPVKVAHRSE
jgi:hypothetical protein